MKIHLYAVGRLKQKALLDLYNEYGKRLKLPLILKEFESKKAEAPAKMKDVADQILKLLSPSSLLIVLDERGQDHTSMTFSRFLENTQNNGIMDLVFVIGGAEGLDPTLKKRANHMIRFGSMTWPHMLVRIMLIEQLYRAQQILSGHPYHKA